MATKLKNLKITKVDFVDDGANPEAHIRLFKSKDGVEPPHDEGAEKKPNIWKRLITAITKAAGSEPDTSELESVIDDIQKSSESFGERIAEVKNRKIADEIWDICYALQSSLCSILNDEEMDGTSAATAMQESLDEFCEFTKDAISQETTDPDPVMAMNKFVKELYPECIVVGLDRMEEITEASRETPVIYCRLNSMEKVEETNTVVWMDGKLAIHILCPDTDMRLKMAAAITNAMSLDGEVTMLDYSPMFIRKLQMDNKSDYLKDGQIFVTGRYGLLRYKAKPHQLNRTTQNYF